MKADREKTALHGWEEEDYGANQQKLKELADKLAGKKH